MSKDKPKHAGGRPKKGERVSGVYDLTTTQGKLGAAALTYPKFDDINKTAEIDTDMIKSLIDQYISDNTKTNIDPKTNKQIINQSPVSYVGLRIKLNNITQSTYSLWLRGYVNQDDIDNIGCNNKLSGVMRAGDNYITRYMSEGGGKYDMQRCLRFLESHGEIAPTKIVNDHNISLLRGGKWGKRAE
jgi:hypothetical protein